MYQEKKKKINYAEEIKEKSGEVEKKEIEKINLSDDLYEVDILQQMIFPVYWQGPSRRVRR